MTKYKIYCAECKKEWIIDDEEFTRLVNIIEDAASKMTTVLSKHGVPVAFKSFLHTGLILNYGLMRCCYKSEIYLSELDSPEQDSPIKVIHGDMSALLKTIKENDWNASKV